MKNELRQIRDEILDRIIEKSEEAGIDFSVINDAHFRRQTEALFKVILKEKKEISLSHHEQDELLSDIVSHLLGLGPIYKLLKDPNISEIMINGPDQIYIEEKGGLRLANIKFTDEQHLSYLVERVLAPLGRRVTELEPYVDARLSDGSRVNIIRSPVSTIGPVLTIRKFSYKILNIDDLIKIGTLDSLVAGFLKASVVARLNLLISGSASSGKTTLLNVLGSFIPEAERVITIEDTRELHLDRKHTVPLEVRPPNIEGKGEITIRDLLRNSLHMRPDRIIIGEVRSIEVLDMVQAMNTGHEGSMTTLHSNSPLEALDRLEVLTLMGSSNVSSEVAKRQIISAVDLVVHMIRLADGSRRVTQVSEILKGKEYALQDIFIFDEAKGELVFTGNIPILYQRLKKKAGYVCEEFERAK